MITFYVLAEFLAVNACLLIKPLILLLERGFPNQRIHSEILLPVKLSARSCDARCANWKHLAKGVIFWRPDGRKRLNTVCYIASRLTWFATLLGADHVTANWALASSQAAQRGAADSLLTHNLSARLNGQPRFHSSSFPLHQHIVCFLAGTSVKENEEFERERES